MLEFLMQTFIAVIVINVILFYVYFDHKGAFTMYGESYYRWMFFFIYMLLGAIVGFNHDKIQAGKCDILKLMVCVAAWYAVPILSAKFPRLTNFQWLSLLPLVGVCYYFYTICTYRFWEKLYNHRLCGQLIFVVGGICLETYLVQHYLWSDILNGLFPLNIPIMMVYVLMVAYVMKFFSNLIAQTFKDDDYNWKKMFLYKNE